MSDNKKLEPGMAYNTKILNKIFAFLSVLFFIVVVWVFLDDYIRPWKQFQIEAMQIRKEKINRDIVEQQKGLDPQKINEMQAAIVSAKEETEKNHDRLQEIDLELAEVQKLLRKQNITNGEYNAQVSALTFQYESAVAHKDANTDKLFTKLRDYKKLFSESKDIIKGLTQKQKDFIAERELLVQSVTDAEKNLSSLVGTLERMQAAQKKTEFDLIFLLRNLPFIDYLDPTIKIQQIVVNRVNDDRYFQKVPKVDRCITCHTFINEPGYEDQPQPFKTHPNLDLMVGEASPHKMKEFGCTSCHGGEGHRVVSFNSAAHMPRDEKQEKEWVEKYHWHRPHKVPQEMLRVGQTEASCVKCHQGVDVIPKGTVINEGRGNIEKFGCYACHKIEGWEHKRKPGPSLEKVSHKISKDFFKSWVWSPKTFNKHSKMPSYFMQSHNSRPEFAKLSVAEVNAMAEYVWSKSKDYTPFATYKGGNADTGKELIKNVGCLSCHGVEGLEEESKKVKGVAGPYLTGSGSKLSGDWLVSWLVKPSHYQENTIMPSFRLSEQESQDIAAYLLSLKNKTFENLKFEPLVPSDRDKLLVDYFSAFDTEEVAHAKLKKMSEQERTLELGYRSIGKYGCYSCHTIEGFDGRAPIGPELTKVGSKPITQFGFGHEKVPHERDAWIKAHLLNPSRWDNGTDKSYQDIGKMPNFYMTEKEASDITVALLGQVAEVIPYVGRRILDSREARVEKGRKVIQNFNCMGCHQVDGERGNILAIYQDDINEGPPRLNAEGHRIQTQWLYHFLDNVAPIRPWLKVRMPSYELTSDHKNAIIEYFQAKADMPTFIELPEKVSWKAGEREAAVKLFETFACASCHTQGFNKDQPMAPNLHHAKARLRPTWIKKWLYNPQAILEGTSMPAFWVDGESTAPDILDGDTDRQIEALTKYILEMGNNTYPPAYGPGNK
jgi:mono/diheme cytochrome c family protein